MSAGWSVPTADSKPCSLCGDRGVTSVGMIRLARPDSLGNRYTHGRRCRDHAACRARWEANNPGEQYPVSEVRSRVEFTGEPDPGAPA